MELECIGYEWLNWIQLTAFVVGITLCVLFTNYSFFFFAYSCIKFWILLLPNLHFIYTKDNPDSNERGAFAWRKFWLVYDFLDCWFSRYCSINLKFHKHMYTRQGFETETPRTQPCVSDYLSTVVGWQMRIVIFP